uniref:Arf-GAP with coiled-coil, ANK repeat and PH domain-containing protein n=1 Tax=Sinocyclocheilus rhinocerous TaxID=307959 RepID=A0A673LW63_9TELE
DVCELESKLDKLVKLCIGMIDAGKAYNTANRQFVNGIQELAQTSAKDDVIEVSADDYLHFLYGNSLFYFYFFIYLQILFDQAQRSIKSQLQTFIREDLRKFKEAKKQFDKVSEEKEAALSKNAQAPRNKQHEVEEATSILIATRKCFRHIVLDYVLQINVLQSKRRSEILKSMLSFMYAHLTFFHQGYDLFSELQPLMKQLTGQLDQLVMDSTKERKDMEMKHSTIQQKDFSNDDTKLEYNVDAENGIVMEGYLFKRASNAFKTWNRRWFSIQNNQLVYQKKFKDNRTVVVEDLRLCTVKHCEDIERRFCFEVVSPTKSCMMQADSEKLRQAWIKAVQNSIATAFRDKAEDMDRKSSASSGSLDSGGEVKERSLKGESSALQRVMTIGGNSSCCDCGQPEPRWASINLSITLCIQCSGIHRSLGVHFSKVRSLTLDTWEPELLKLMCELGNGVINHIYEARREELGARKPQPGDPRYCTGIILFIFYYFFHALWGPFNLCFALPWPVYLLLTSVSIHAMCSDHRGRMFVVFYRVSVCDPNAALGFCVAEANHESLFCVDELDSLFSYFNTSTKPCCRLSDLQSCHCSGHRLGDGSHVLLIICRSEAPEPHEESSGEDLEVFCEPKQLTPGLQLYWASFSRSLPDMAEALAHGAEVNWTNTDHENRTPLIMAVHGGSLASCEFLLQNSASVNQQDNLGRGPLHHATLLGHTGQACLFLKRGANQNAADVENQTPLSIAVKAANADIVTLLRLAKMNEEMRESEGLYSQSGDETYQDIFQDFSQMASNDPDKLNRY